MNGNRLGGMMVSLKVHMKELSGEYFLMVIYSINLVTVRSITGKIRISTPELKTIV